MEFDGEHYWEIGRGFKLNEIVHTIEQSNWIVRDEYRAPENRYHHFFIIEPQLTNPVVPEGANEI